MAKQEKELVKGQCEHCGRNYRRHIEPKASGEIEVICKCGKISENWDTPNSPQMAPSIIELTR